MSTIVTSNVSDGTLSIPTTYVTNGSAKAWVNFKGDGTAAVRDSLNITSLTDNGTGDYSLAITNAMAASDYAVTATTCIEGGESDMRTAAINLNRSFNTTTFGIKTMLGQSTDTDRSQIDAAAHGDLA